MRQDPFKYISAMIAVGIYLLLASVLFYYFNYRSSERAIHYVKKSTPQALSVSLAEAPRLMPQKPAKEKQTSSKHRPKKVRNLKSGKRAPQRSKRAKKAAKKIQAKQLFSSVHTAKTPSKKAAKRTTASQRTANQKQAGRESLKKPNSGDKGVENRYLASVEQKLRGWPEQANFAGEQISVVLTIYPSGRFDFKVQHLSANSEFNEALLGYLRQLQSIGLGKHTHNRPYTIEVEFEATE